MLRYVIVLALLITAPAAAHHGWSSYDESKSLTVTGTLTQVNWTNPHGTAQMTWNKELWTIVLAPTQRMDARGLTQAMIAPGQRVILTGYARRDGTREMRIERITAGGKTVELR
ncbi:DUF6152 family protein [Sphingomonas quercus]|uniref:Uncharacterized protein n=1 Tax=Sphingomonas quercus TaxID=2842451 RepID=A0ABS6BH72_9SPHN|nr:DUF6152 family protein [Sphingomonas quercus]MBU3077658.1 hypothetical protein [Sphingomonas quercus]